MAEDYAQARDFIEDNILGGWGESYLPLGDLLIQTKAALILQIIEERST